MNYPQTKHLVIDDQAFQNARKICEFVTKYLWRDISPRYEFVFLCT